MRYSVSNKQKPRTIPIRKCNNYIWALLYNSLPKYLRDIESVKTEKFKFELDKFLELIPDEPKMPNCVTEARSNSIIDQLTHLRAQGIYHGGGVPNSAMEQCQLFRNDSKYPIKNEYISSPMMCESDGTSWATQIQIVREILPFVAAVMELIVQDVTATAILSSNETAALCQFTSCLSSMHILSSISVWAGSTPPEGVLRTSANQLLLVSSDLQLVKTLSHRKNYYTTAVGKITLLLSTTRPALWARSPYYCQTSAISTNIKNKSLSFTSDRRYQDSKEKLRFVSKTKIL